MCALRVLTVAVVAGVDASLQRFSLSELGQHLCKGAALETQRAGGLLPTVVALWELQGQVPERLHCVRLVLARKTRHLEDNERETETHGREGEGEGRNKKQKEWRKNYEE